MESTTLEITDVDWAFADMVARHYVLKDDWIRAFLAEMMASTRSGNVCIEVSDDQLRRIPECLIAKGANADRLLKHHGSKLYFHRYWHLESKLIEPILKRIIATPEIKPQPIDGLNAKQHIAVSQAMACQFFILSGGPGTGKTHTIARIVEQFSGQSIALAAPTGKAVSKLRESIVNPGIFFGTLHALLDIKQAKDVLKIPAKLPYNIVIVDECSMIDIGMWGALLEACSEDTRLILVGDANQLPSVEGGSVFEQLCHFFQTTQSVGLVQLTECMRTDQKELQQIAVQVLQGRSQDIPLVDLPSAPDLIQHLSPLFTQKLPDGIDNTTLLAEGKKFQLLCALRKGPNGCDALNQMLHSLISKELKKDDRLAVPIIITRNAFDLGLSNGDTGVWIHGQKEDVVIFEDRVMPRAMVPSFDLAYVLSVHKSQGSEYENIYLLLPPGSEYFGRKVLYTAITRARSKLTIAGSCDTVQMCIENATTRLSGLSDRLRGIK
ncbi:MAG: AAA family ATPase [Chlamydiales bacterium]|nr:AAA family ATPase [Chlamydiales bacterium]